jgi:hypothetical protein
MDDCALLPCLAVSRTGEAMMDAVVEMLKVECESPPVPTMSHFFPFSYRQQTRMEEV